ncbi:MAG: hydroxymethylbilane synthase [Chloroflexota bacterium]
MDSTLAIQDKANSTGQAILGTRKSQLARWQTEHVQSLLHAAWPDFRFDVRVFTTKGDKIIDVPLPLIGGKGLFTLELENALRNGAIDIAVHSLKDLPTDSPKGLTIGSIPPREEAADVLVSRGGETLEALPNHATIGTSSRRRAAQLLHFRPDLQIIDIRGNVDTRIQKTLDPDGPYHASVLAFAGIHRIEQDHVISQILPDEIMLPAPGQGALGVQCRDDKESIQLLAPIHAPIAAAEVIAERSFLAALGGGCATPVAAKATVDDLALTLTGRVTTLDGVHQIEVYISGLAENASFLGEALAQEALEKGAQEILDQCQAAVH